LSKILLVEDNLVNRVLARDILVFNGFTVVEAETGVDAIKRAKMDLPDLILMDLHLPQMDGITATKYIKEDPDTSGIPVVALTASAMKEDLEKVMSHGFDGYISKPIDIDSFVKTVKEIISQRKDKTA